MSVAQEKCAMVLGFSLVDLSFMLKETFLMCHFLYVAMAQRLVIRKPLV